MTLDFPAGGHSSEKDLVVNMSSPHNAMLLPKRKKPLPPFLFWNHLEPMKPEKTAKESNTFLC